MRSTARANAEVSPLMTPAALKSYSHKDLAQMAKQGGVRGWHSMRKDQLVKALLTAAKPKASPANGKKVAAPARAIAPAKADARARTARKPANGRVQRHISQIKAKLERIEESGLASNGKANGKPLKERIVVMVRDPYLAARLLGNQAAERRARAGRDEPGLAHRAALPAIAGSLRRRHHQRLGARGPRHRSPRRREQLVRPRRQLAQQLSAGNRLHGLERPVLPAGPQQRGQHARAGQQRRDRRELDRRGRELRQDLRHERRLLARQQQPRAAGAVRRAAAAADGLADGDALRLGHGRLVPAVAGLQVRGRRRDDRLRRDQSQHARQPARRAGAAAARRHASRCG